MKKILYICDISLKNPIRGTPLRIHHILREIRKEHNLTICARDVEPEFSEIHLPYPNLKGWMKVKHFVDFIKKYNIDVVLTSTEIGIKLPILLKLLTKVEIAVELHGLYGEELFLKGSIGSFRKVVYDWQLKFYLLFYDLVAAVSEKLKFYYRFVNQNIVVWYGGADKSALDLPIFTPSVFTVGYTGNIRPYQGLPYLLEALQKIRNREQYDFRLNFVLSGDEAEARGLIEKYGLSNIATLNFNVSYNEVGKIMANSSILVVPRPSIPVTEYAFPSKMTEDWATGIPVLLTKVGPVEELVGEKDFCKVVEPSNMTENLEAGLVELMILSQDERQKMGQAAREFVKNNLLWEIFGKKMNRDLENIK